MPGDPRLALVRVRALSGAKTRLEFPSAPRSGRGPAHRLSHPNFPHACPNRASPRVLLFASDGIATFLPPAKRLPRNAYRISGRPERHRALSLTYSSLLHELDEPTPDPSTLFFPAHIDVH